MRTRRIAIACRRTGSANTVVIAPSGSAGAPEPWPIDLLPIDLLPIDLLPIDLTAVPEPLPSRTPNPPGAHTRQENWIDGPDGRADAGHIPTPAAPPPGDRDLTLAELTCGTRRDLGWNENPGWPADFDWTRIACVARNNPPRGHSPRHARHTRRGVPTIPHRAFVLTGAGVVAAALLTVLVALLG